VTTLNLTPVLDALGGATVTTATFKAEARRAGRRAVRVEAALVTFPIQLTASWDGSGWDHTPALYPLPADCYWNVVVAAKGNRLERNTVLPGGSSDTVDFADLIDVTPDSGTADSSAIAQVQAAMRYISNQRAYIDGVAATVFDSVATVQAQIDTLSGVAATAQAALANVQTVQAEIDDDLSTVVTAATQTALDREAVNTARDAVDAARAAVDETIASLTTIIDGNI